MEACATERICINGYKAVTGAGTGTRKYGASGTERGDPNSAGVLGVEDLIGNLRSIVLIFDGASIRVQDAKAQVHLGDLGVNWPVEHPESSADYRLVILEWIPGERDTRGDITVVGIQRVILRVDSIAQAVVQSEIGAIFQESCK